ncbi:MAG: hypothetical protein ACHQO8_07555 [Vicinamibacterales bacterium]
MRATPGEQRRALEGDGLISAPFATATHAILIRRDRRDVWPWLVQMGAGRAGWYSYDRLDNGGEPSAERIRPDLQSIEVGAVMPALPGIREGFVVVSFEPERSIVLGWPDARRGHTVTWAFVLDERAAGTTRLLTRVRAAGGYRLFGLPLPAPLTKLLTLLVHFVMQRRQLMGIARRAEAAPPQPPTP